MTDVERLTKALIDFRDARDWQQFHNPKDLALSLSLESAEVLEHFQWKNGTELEEYLATHQNDIADELADVFNWVLILAHDLNINIVQASERKIEKNDKKYPVEKAKGTATKYTEL